MRYEMVSLRELYDLSDGDPIRRRLFFDEVRRRYGGQHPWRYAIDTDNPTLARDLLSIPVYGCGVEIIAEAIDKGSTEVLEEIYSFDPPCFRNGIREYMQRAGGESKLYSLLPDFSEEVTRTILELRLQPQPRKRSIFRYSRRW